MAHTCPNCGMLCYCRGDIDDIDFGERWDCLCDCDHWNNDDDDYDDDGRDEDYGDLEAEC